MGVAAALRSLAHRSFAIKGIKKEVSNFCNTPILRAVSSLLERLFEGL